jgi:hypothetical protein
VIDERSALGVDVRSLDGSAITAAWAHLTREVGDIDAPTATTGTLAEVPCTAVVTSDKGLRAAIADAAGQLGPPFELASGAGHDAECLAPRADPSTQRRSRPQSPSCSSPEASSVTGANFAADGGYTVR